MTLVVPIPKPLKTVFRDLRDSWTLSSDKRIRRLDIARALLYFYGLPVLVGLAFVRFEVRINAVTPLLTAMSVFTALLFGLLFLIFNLAVTLRKDGAQVANAHGLEQTVEDLRATITYAILVAAVLLVGLVVASQMLVPINPKDPKSATALEWWWTPVLALLAAHLLLNVLRVLNLFRTAFNYILR